MSEDSAPILADAILALINSKPRTPTKDEMVEVIRNHVEEQLRLAMGGQLEITWGSGGWNTGTVTLVPVSNATVSNATVKYHPDMSE